MADVAFIIPQKLEDLCTYSNERYVVRTDYTGSEVKDMISGKQEKKDWDRLCPHAVSE